MLEINSSKYIKTKQVLIDGMSWTIKLPGAGNELAMSQAKRRIDQLDSKIKAGTMTDEDYDRYDKLEKQMLDTFTSMFQDGTKDNSSVTEWLNRTPLAVVQMVMEDIKKQTADNEKAENATESATATT